MSTKRIFFALWPSDRQRDQLRNAISPVAKEIEGNAIYRGEWHITLAFIGEFKESLIPALQEAARLIPVRPFRLRFDRAEYWPRPKVGVLLAPTVPPELEHLVLSLEILLTKIGIEPEHRTYRPHITIVRRARPFETQRLAQPALVEWSDFELVESVTSPRGATYRPINQ
ncbi:MAG: RNA 2',3'-cyclic phosphodiesterase [Woeseiaceae bacterium]